MAASLLALVVLGLIVVNRLSSAAHLERRIDAAIGGDYKVDIGHARYNPLSGIFTADYIAIEPDTVNYKEPRRKTWYFTATGIRIEGIRQWALYRKSLDAERVHLDTPRLHLTLDRHVAPEVLHHPSVLPQEHLRRLPHPLRVGTVEITDCEIVYSERARDGARPGTFVFADIAATVTNVSNDPSLMTVPSTIQVRSRLADAGEMHGTFEYHLATDSLTMSGEGAVGKLDATTLNALLVNLNGIHVTSGTIDSTWFTLNIDEDVATGKVRCLYRGVHFEILDKNTRKQDLKDQLATFMGEHKTRESNPEEADEPPMIAAVHLRREPDDNLLKFVWITVRDGLMRTLGVIE